MGPGGGHDGRLAHDSVAGAKHRTRAARRHHHPPDRLGPRTGGRSPLVPLRSGVGASRAHLSGAPDRSRESRDRVARSGDFRHGRRDMLVGRSAIGFGPRLLLGSLPGRIGRALVGASSLRGLFGRAVGSSSGGRARLEPGSTPGWGRPRASGPAGRGGGFRFPPAGGYLLAGRARHGRQYPRARVRYVLLLSRMHVGRRRPDRLPSGREHRLRGLQRRRRSLRPARLGAPGGHR